MKTEKQSIFFAFWGKSYSTAALTRPVSARWQLQWGAENPPGPIPLSSHVLLGHLAASFLQRQPRGGGFLHMDAGRGGCTGGFSSGFEVGGDLLLWRKLRGVSYTPKDPSIYLPTIYLSTYHDPNLHL